MWRWRVAGKKILRVGYLVRGARKKLEAGAERGERGGRGGRQHTQTEPHRRHALRAHPPRRTRAHSVGTPPVGLSHMRDEELRARLCEGEARELCVCESVDKARLWCVQGLAMCARG